MDFVPVPLNFRIELRWLIVPLTVIILLLAAAAAFAYEGDGRINLDGYMGGDSVYCVDANMNPTSDPTHAGIRLLNLRGEQLMYVSPEQIAAVPHNPAANTVIAQGSGSYGPIYLERLTDGRFQLIGVEDHGKTFWFTWTDCVQVTPIPNGHSNGPASYSDQLADFCRDEFEGEDRAQCLAVVDSLTIICNIQELSVKECINIFVVD